MGYWLVVVGVGVFGFVVTGGVYERLEGAGVGQRLTTVVAWLAGFAASSLLGLAALAVVDALGG